MVEKVDVEDGWEEITAFLSKKASFKLTRGSEFTAIADRSKDEIIITPKETGIARVIGKQEWNRFVEKFNEVVDSGYDPLRPGHYARISFNSSYLIAIVKKKEGYS